MKYIRIICLYLKNYISDKQFENIFYQHIEDFKNNLEEDIYWNILSSNFNKKENLITLKTYLYKYILKNYSLIYDEVNDTFVEILIETNEYYEVIEILKKKYKQKEEVLIDCHSINNELELLYSVKKNLNFPQHCGNNWDAIEDFISDIILPKKIILHNWDSIKEKLPLATMKLESILNKVDQKYCKILYT